MTEEKQVHEDLDPDMEERVQGFAKELTPLLGKYELGVAAMPEIDGHGRVVAKPIFISTRKPSTEKVEEKPVANDTVLSE